MSTLPHSHGYLVSAAVSFSQADRILDRAGIDAKRIRSTPVPGSVTIEDLIRALAEDGRL